MTHPARWRETCDPFALHYRAFTPTEILGYPHARNDVFHARGLLHGEERTVYIKAARHPDSAIAHEATILSQLRGPEFPRVLDSGSSPVPFSVTQELPGQRLSILLGDNADMASLSYMEEYGAALARLHRLSPEAPAQADRRFRHKPPEALLEKLGLNPLRRFFDAPPACGKTVFCHGDLHYANVLWDAQHISAILDFELSGYGERDFDVAWALFLRPGQRFLKTAREQQRFLDGYRQLGDFDPAAVRYYMAQAYVYFLEFSGDDSAYCTYIRTWLSAL